MGWRSVSASYDAQLSFVAVTASTRLDVPVIFLDMMEEAMECEKSTLPLHLKIVVWHDYQKRIGQAQHLDIGELKTTISLSQETGCDWQALGIDGARTAGTTCAPVQEAHHSGSGGWWHAAEGCAENLQLISPAESRTGMGRDCTELHFLSLFRQLRAERNAPLRVFVQACCTRSSHVPDSYVTATASLMEKCKSMKGTAGCKRSRLIK